MFEKPKRKRSEGTVYRPRLLLRAAQLGYMALAIPLYVLWISFFLRSSALTCSLPLLLFSATVMVFQFWLIYQTSFRQRLILSTDGGEYHILGYEILFRWEDVIRLERMWWGQRRDWYLVLARTTEVKRPNRAWLVNRLYKSLETHIPLSGFISITAVRLFSVDFWGTSLGREISLYAPHLYEPYWRNQFQKTKP